MVHYLPTVNAALNATATVLLVIGWVLIKQRRETAHKRVMLTAFGVSVAFLICYLIYHAQVGSVKFTGPSPIRQMYLTMLAHARGPGRHGAVSGRADDLSWAERSPIRPQPVGEMDLSHLAVRVGNRRADLRDAVFCLPGRRERGYNSAVGPEPMLGKSTLKVK